ncbi:MAG: hypothetical protein OXE95_09495 [Chloroflexi bacterium]|nr:hypothetical protein [Chloroflexota bacterium]MCY4247792.1 hypothetical protein [Chloroflexota bacterium]
MNIFGIGAWELMAILLIMLVFAGPKRMIHWSYVLGQHVARFRKIWAETVDVVQKEFDDAGLDIKLPKEPPTRQNMNRAIAAAAKPLTQPVQDTLDEVKKDIDTVQEVSDTLNQQPAKTTLAPWKTTAKAAAKPAVPAKASQPAALEPVKMGSWSGETNGASSSNGSAPDLGSWSSGGEQDRA